MLKPLDNRVILKRLSAEKKVGGIIVTKDASEKPRGMVMAVGAGKLLSTGAYSAVPVTVGDKVIFDEGAVQATVRDRITVAHPDSEDTYEEQELLVVNADGLLAIGV